MTTHTNITVTLDTNVLPLGFVYLVRIKDGNEWGQDVPYSTANAALKAAEEWITGPSLEELRAWMMADLEKYQCKHNMMRFHATFSTEHTEGPIAIISLMKVF